MARILPYVDVFRWVLWVVLSCLAWSPARGQDDAVYRVRDRNGREVYTNLDGSASHGAELRKLDLPELSSVDFAGTSPDELRRLDASIEDVHSALQSGERCEAIRKSSRVPLRTRLWDEHGPKIYVSAALLAFAALLAMVRRGKRLGSLLPLVPFAGFAFLLYTTITRTQSALQTLNAGLRACSEQLPDAQPEDADTVKSRLSKALDVRRSINQAYDRQAEQIEAIMRER